MNNAKTPKITAKALIDKNIFTLAADGSKHEMVISKCYCCDLLSLAMKNMPTGAAWFTVMGNINTLAVASLCDAACIILAEGVKFDAACLEKAKEQGITVFYTDMPIFDAALKLWEAL